MNRIFLGIAALLAIVIAVGAAWWVLVRADGDRGAPASTSDRYALQPFRQIVLEGDAAVTLVQGTSESIAIDVSGGSVVHAEVHDNVLTVRAGDDRRWWSHLFGGMSRRSPQITIAFRDIDTVRGSGAVKLAAEGLKLDTLSLRFSGAAEVKVTALEARSLTMGGSGAFKAELGGHVDEQRLSISGAGDYRAGDLVSEHASISVSGAGRVLVNAQKTLDVDLSGAGKVDYIGDPKVTQRVSGAGRIRRQDRAEHTFRLAAPAAWRFNAAAAESRRA